MRRTGGKDNGLIAQSMENSGRVAACDTQPERLDLLRENCARLGVTCVEYGKTGPFDRILVDAPCSNTGVLRRRVDLRWRVKPGEIEELARTQQALLSEAAAQLKPGGTLVYSTCSLEPEENESVTEEFLDGHPDFKLESQRQLLPMVDGVDGAFVARMTKSG